MLDLCVSIVTQNNENEMGPVPDSLKTSKGLGIRTVIVDNHNKAENAAGHRFTGSTGFPYKCTIETSRAGNGTGCFYQ